MALIKRRNAPSLLIDFVVGAIYFRLVISAVSLCNETLMVTQSALAGFESRPTAARGPWKLKPSDPAPVLPYGSGSSCNLLAKILGGDTPVSTNNFIFNFLH